MKIYIDMDGVLTDCHTGALCYYGVHLEEYPMNMRVKDVLAGMNIRTPSTHEAFWGGFEESFWTCLEKTDFCDDLIELSNSLVGEDNVFIASRPTSNPESYSGKACWVQSQLPYWTWDNLILIQDKSLLAGTNTLLIDDHPVNCNKFRGSGGQSILVERPWNGHPHMVWTDLMTAICAER